MTAAADTTPAVLSEERMTPDPALKALYDTLAKEGGGTWATYVMVDFGATIEAAVTKATAAQGRTIAALEAQVQRLTAERQGVDPDHEAARLIEHFGGEANWWAVSRQLLAWASKNLPARAVDELSATYDGVMAIHRMMTAAALQPSQGGATTTTGATTPHPCADEMQSCAGCYGENGVCGLPPLPAPSADGADHAA